MKQNKGLDITLVVVTIVFYFLLGLNGSLLIFTLVPQLLGLTDLFANNSFLTLLVSFLLPPLLASLITYLFVTSIFGGFVKKYGVSLNYKIIKITLVALIFIFYIFNF